VLPRALCRSFPAGLPGVVRILVGMPTKLRMIVLLLVLALGLDAILLATGDADAGLALLMNGLILIGLLTGKDGARTFVIGLSYLSLVSSAAFPLYVLLASKHLPSIGPILGLVIGAGLGFASAAYTIWALKQSDVREWMFRRAFHIAE